MEARPAEVWAVYSDGTENGRRVRHVHATTATIDEAKDALRWYADLGITFAIKRFASEDEAKRFEIDGSDESYDPMERLDDIRDYYSQVS